MKEYQLKKDPPSYGEAKERSVDIQLSFDLEKVKAHITANGSFSKRQRHTAIVDGREYKCTSFVIIGDDYHDIFAMVSGPGQTFDSDDSSSERTHPDGTREVK